MPAAAALDWGGLQVGLLCSAEAHDCTDTFLFRDLALGVGGLVAGGLLTNAFEHHEERVRDDGYEQG
jgi:hypothetical protein